MTNPTDNREYLVDWYKTHAENIELEAFNELLAKAGFDPIVTIQTVEVTMTFKVDVSDLELMEQGQIELDSAQVYLSHSDDYSYRTAESSDGTIVSVEVTG